VVAPGGGQQGPLWQSVAADRTHQQAPSADEAGDWNVSTAAYAPVNEPLADAQPAPGQAEAAPMRRRSLLGGNAQPAPTPAPPAPTPAPAANETPARRPIVRAPSVAKGVREVDTNTGELTIIQPANPNPPAVQRTEEIVSTQDEFEDEVLPNWGAFSQARAKQQAHSAPNEALADTGLYDHLEDDESGQEGRGLRIFLTMLLIIVLALVVAAVVWFVVLDGGSTNALALGLASLE
jgi:possible alginate regulatory protein algP